MKLRYGMNPQQRPATATPIDPDRQPFEVLHGEPSYINVLDAAGAWQLVREASAALGRPAGLRLTEPRDPVVLTRDLLTGPAADDLLLGMIVVKHTQSNSVAYIRNGMALGIGAGQQSRVDCTQLAGAKVDTWWLRRHPSIGEISGDIARQLAAAAAINAADRADWLRRLDDVAFVSGGALPFPDNVDEAARHGVRHIAEPGGSIRSGDVADACERLGIALVHTGVRLFQH